MCRRRNIGSFFSVSHYSGTLTLSKFLQQAIRNIHSSWRISLLLFEWRLYVGRVHMEDISFHGRDKILLAHKCQGSLDFSASEPRRRGTLAGLLLISRKEERCGFATLIDAFFFSCLLLLSFASPIISFWRKIEVFSDLDRFRNQIAPKVEGLLFFSLNQTGKTNFYRICLFASFKLTLTKYEQSVVHSGTAWEELYPLLLGLCSIKVIFEPLLLRAQTVESGAITRQYLISAIRILLHFFLFFP